MGFDSDSLDWNSTPKERFDERERGISGGLAGSCLIFASVQVQGAQCRWVGIERGVEGYVQILRTNEIQPGSGPKTIWTMLPFSMTR